MKQTLEISARFKDMKIPLTTLSFLASLKSTSEFEHLKIVAAIYIDSLRKEAFGLRMYNDAERHQFTDFQGQAIGIKFLIDIVESSEKRLRDLRDEKEPKK